MIDQQIKNLPLFRDLDVVIKAQIIATKSLPIVEAISMYIGTEDKAIQAMLTPQAVNELVAKQLFDVYQCNVSTGFISSGSPSGITVQYRLYDKGNLGS